ncbi:aspartyl/asparaginyl beta-hydroxylase domain-containing protein [Sphingorhabdus sp. EL138]|uniref:aspartyl/asparaginyl beta-hydroxylase domain-containing protein n=1 Tax=Sphingorhabdus sp. EL138 TaxID=2073156 RepID=UPI0025F0ACC5|nr:aspartyl/asparaginyl beta-hydroxylase domain-containing protein [Sphingorhabdus sp. EL138]
MNAGASNIITDARAALQRRDGALAQRLLAELPESEMPWLLLAQTCNLLGNVADEEAALQRLLALEPRNLPALILSGELKARMGDDRAANSFFQAALNQAAATPNVPSALHPMLHRAREFIGQVQVKFEQHLIDGLKQAGLTRDGRVGTAVDMLLGRKQLYVQQPSSFYFPGLPQRQFYEREEFPWLMEIEAAVPAMQAELCAVLADDQDFAPYVEANADRPLAANPLMNDPKWGAYYFWRNGTIVPENAARCPVTMQALTHAPMPLIDQRSPIALWSLLKPDTHIQPHHGLLNTRLICHIPLIVPQGCAIRVGNETRSWRAGEALIFDDSFEHEAWNKSNDTRVILLFEIWRPEISLDERAALTTIFETINNYHGVPEDAG